MHENEAGQSLGRLKLLGSIGMTSGSCHLGVQGALKILLKRFPLRRVQGGGGRVQGRCMDAAGTLHGRCMDAAHAARV